MSLTHSKAYTDAAVRHKADLIVRILEALIEPIGVLPLHLIIAGYAAFQSQSYPRTIPRRLLPFRSKDPNKVGCVINAMYYQVTTGVLRDTDHKLDGRVLKNEDRLSARPRCIRMVPDNPKIAYALYDQGIYRIDTWDRSVKMILCRDRLGAPPFLQFAVSCDGKLIMARTAGVIHKIDTRCPLVSSVDAQIARDPLVFPPLQRSGIHIPPYDRKIEGDVGIEFDRTSFESRMYVYYYAYGSRLFRVHNGHAICIAEASVFSHASVSMELIVSTPGGVLLCTGPGLTTCVFAVYPRTRETQLIHPGNFRDKSTPSEFIETTEYGLDATTSEPCLFMAGKSLSPICIPLPVECRDGDPDRTTIPESAFVEDLTF